MDNNEIDILCSCSKCHKYFKRDEITTKTTILYGKSVEERVTPCCKVAGYTQVDQENLFNRYDPIYLANNFNRYTNINKGDY